MQKKFQVCSKLEVCLKVRPYSRRVGKEILLQQYTFIHHYFSVTAVSCAKIKTVTWGKMFFPHWPRSAALVD